jgi:hypothetical protein
MATVLRYRNDGGQPFCEVALENGDSVLIMVEAGGVIIKREARLDISEEVLFLGTVHLATEICLALLDGRPASETTVLDIFLAIVSQFRSADDIRAAFAKVSAGR